VAAILLPVTLTVTAAAVEREAKAITNYELRIFCFAGRYVPPFQDLAGVSVIITQGVAPGWYVASVRSTKGIFWGGLLVETFGGASEDLSEKGLRQEDARMMAEQLKECLQD